MYFEERDDDEYGIWEQGPYDEYGICVPKPYGADLYGAYVQYVQYKATPSRKAPCAVRSSGLPSLTIWATPLSSV